MPSNPLDDIAVMVESRIAGQVPSINLAVDAALNPDRLRAMVESSLKDLDKQIEQAVANKVARCISEKLGLASIDAKINSLLNAQIDSHILDQYGC